MLDDTIKRLEVAKMALNKVSCFNCWHFDLRQRDIVNYEGKNVRVMRGCKDYRNCHDGGPKSLWAAR